jgi:hypothetical protein
MKNRFVWNAGDVAFVNGSGKKSVTKSVNKNARREAIWKAFDSRATAKEGMFIEAVKKYSEKQKAQVITAIKGLDILIKAVKAEGDDDDEYGIDDELDTVFTEKSNKALKSALAAAWIASLESGREHFYAMTGIDPKDPKIAPSLTVTNELFNSWVEKNGLLRAEGINATTNEKLRKQLSQAISDGISNGDNLNTIKNSILDVCDSVYYDLGADTNLEAAYRAKLIARNEAMQSVNFGNHATMKAEGIQKREWLSTLDDRCRDAHADADGQVVGIDEPFIVADESLDYPGDSQHGSAENTISCRCTEMAVIADDSEEE